MVAPLGAQVVKLALRQDGVENSVVFLPKNKLSTGILRTLSVLSEGEPSTGHAHPLQPVTPAPVYSPTTPASCQKT